jgi:hypothetical protein
MIGGIPMGRLERFWPQRADALCGHVNDEVPVNTV